MNRFELSKKLTRELGGDFVVVASPDHPELASGPDLLVGGRGRITATFRIARSTSPRLLDARVIATRLAFPAGSRLVALVERDVEPPRHLAEQGFDVVLGNDETQALIRLCSIGQGEGLRLKELRQVQETHAVFYSTVLQISEFRQRHDLKSSSVREVIANLRRREPLVDPSLGAMDSLDVADNASEQRTGKPSRRRSYADSARATVKQTTVAALPASPGESVALRLRPLWSEALSNDFVLDRGVPYHRAHHRAFQPRILLVEAWPEYRFDPHKPARVAAFSGWLMAIATTAEEIEMLIDRSLELVSKRIYA